MNRRNTRDRDLFFHARFFRIAAKKLAATLEVGSGPFEEFDVSPVIFFYRHALELQLKSIVLGEGGNFLAMKPDPISISKSHSVPWLAQFVCQIVTAMGWEAEFKCEGIESQDAFKAVVQQMNNADPGLYVFRWPVDPCSESAIREFTTRMDRLLELLESTADAIAAEWDLRSDTADETGRNDDGNFKPTIQ